MVKANANAAAAAASGPGVYSAVYSGIPVYEFQFGGDLKEHVMRRRHDNWINATHILKAAGFDKPARTRILERDVQKDVHEKIQGGYGKYQGTWIPLESGQALAERHSVFDRLRPIFEYVAGAESPPPAPRHTSKPKGPKSKPPLPKWNNPPPAPAPAPVIYDDPDTVMGDEDTPDNLTVASASYMAEDERFEMPQVPGTGRKRRRDDSNLQDLTEQQHALYGDELLDYFLLSKTDQPAVKPDPPANFQPNWPIDAEDHTALHWASAMGDVDVVKQLKRFNASSTVRNIRGETPFMHSVNFTNCYEKQSFPVVMKELFETFDARDNMGCTVIHHAAVMKNGRVFNSSCSRYYLDNILNKLQEGLEPSAFQRLLDVQDNDGNTALHLAAHRNARKCIRALLGRNASSDLTNNKGVRAEDLIMDLNATKKERGPQRSSSPFAPESQRHASFKDALLEKANRNPPVAFQSAAANTVQSRITPLIMEKFQDLAKSYEEEWREKDVAEAEAKRILANTQADLNALRQNITDAEGQLESEEAASKNNQEANLAKHQVLSLITHQNRLHVQRSVDSELSRINGDGGVQEESYEERLSLARQLSTLLAEQRTAETDYVEALSMVGTGEKIEKYRKLLKRCLDPKEGESLDTNLDSLIEMMEEERDEDGMVGAMESEPMELSGGI
ncbi:putative MBP1-transcription factor, subunit of the MBF factor [Fusarium proliferatum ET1]|uniref:Probable MBP1-transcription factor, subunit of the MBF factor n=1 Tax=Fusarium proliferatum (strain ET1) TaxID=1227346 RepID=A0A1L7VSR3_FUSPR|nr:putative MBP1-transcription factor, subunit of the MBF factor [Fusarium proliferatum ET1]CZR43467.1 probable MBP1-transcription factor, subunit of the MBF factor [Fusarium proliferatum ET1]